jgi:mono/diheme cytochrome c family protein
LAIITLAAPAAAPDERVLRVRDGTEERIYPVAELVAAVGLSELTVPDDPLFGSHRTYAGFDLPALLRHIGLGGAPELLLVCADGYSIPFDAAAALKEPVRGLLALRDTAVPADSGRHWQPYRHGTEAISLDPFFLVWAPAKPGADVDLGPETLPWPYQLTEIRRFDRAAYFAPARPPDRTGPEVEHGFAIYQAHCGKCHQMRGVGGSVGPALDRAASASALSTPAQLGAYVRHERWLFPRSKMPAFSALLAPADIDAVVAYLKAMQTR